MNGWLIEDANEPLEHEASDKEIVTQVTNNVNNENVGNGRNGGNGGNNVCTYKGFMACNPKEYNGKGGAIALTRWIEKIENIIDNSGCAENQKVKYVASSFVNKALTWWNTQVQARGREVAIGMSWADFKALLVEEFFPSNEMEKLEYEFWNHKMVGANHAGYMDRFHELAKLVLHLVTLESSRIKRNQNSRNNGNQVKGKAFNVNVVGALQDPNVVTCTFSLNHHYATVLFDSGADFSFISTSFAPLLNVKSSFVNPRYLIEIADGKKVEVDRVIRMDWLSEHKGEIVCHEKVVRIPLESGEILIFQGEHNPGIAKALSNVKVDEPKLSDIFVV
nr:reverse transcriptase domain-containing protein [Tanacetum cinerariifolium]